MIEDQWVIAEPGVIVLPTTKYEIRRTADGKFQAYHDGKKLGPPEHTLQGAKNLDVRPHMRDLIAVGVEP
jgi:hypothetical protein